MNTEITLLKWPGEEDWMFAKSCALVTIGKHSGKAPDMEWKHKMLRAKHSPIRTLNFAFYLHNVPYYVSTHLARQDAPVDMIWYLNAEGTIDGLQQTPVPQGRPGNTRRLPRGCGRLCTIIARNFAA